MEEWSVKRPLVPWNITSDINFWAMACWSSLRSFNCRPNDRPITSHLSSWWSNNAWAVLISLTLFCSNDIRDLFLWFGAVICEAFEGVICEAFKVEASPSSVSTVGWKYNKKSVNGKALHFQKLFQKITILS